VGAATRGGGPYRVLLFYNAYGLLAEDAWPNSWDCAGYLLYPNPKMFSMTKAVALTFSGTDETVGAICDAIDAGCPVVFGTHISPPHIVEGNNNYYYPPPVLPVKLDCCDGHGMWIYGYNNETRRLKVMNSWGQGWSNNGTCDMSYDFYTTYKFNYYTWVIESVADKPPMPAPTSNMSYSVTVVPGTPATTNGTGDVSAGSVIVHEVKQTDIAYNDLMLFTKNKSFDLGKNLGLNANYYMSVMLLFNKLPNQPGVYVVELSAYIRPYMKLSYSLDGQTTTIDSSGGSYVERSLQFRKFDDLTIVCAAT